MKFFILTLFLVVFIGLSQQNKNENSQDFEKRSFEKISKLLKKFSSEEKEDDISDEEEQVETSIYKRFSPPFSNTVIWNGRGYYYSPNRASWNDARKICRKLWKSSNGYLTKIESQEENDFIQKEFFEKHGQKDIFIGAKDKNKTLHFFWEVDNSELKAANWAKGEPNVIKDNDRCIQLSEGGFWKVADCRLPFYFVCEHNPISPNQDTILWNFREYYYSQNALSFEEAKKFCRSLWGEGEGDLVYINNKIEYKFILNEIFVKNDQKDTYIGANDIENALDFRWSADNSQVKFIEDYPFVWAKGEPNNSGNKERCVQIGQQGYWYDVSCDLRLPFICKAKM